MAARRDTNLWAEKRNGEFWIMAASPIEYVRQVRAEMKKVTWPSRKETTVSTVAVFIMVFLAAIFLFVADQVLSTLVRWILGLGM